MSKSVVFFDALDAGGRMGLWESDGTSAGTYEIGGLGSAGISGALAEFDPTDIAAFGAGVLFQALDNVGGVGLWYSDGTAAGTYEIGRANNAGIANAPTNTLGAGGLEPQSLTIFGSKAAFIGSDPVSGTQELWITDGNAAGALELGGTGNADIGLKQVGSVLAAMGNKLLFNGFDTNGYDGLWVTDGTVADTQELDGKGSAGIPGEPMNGLALSGGLVNLGSLSLFLANDANGYTGLFATDGTTAGTAELVGNGSLGSGPGANYYNAADLVGIGSYALFSAYDAGGYDGLWITDGTVDGTCEIYGPQAVSGASVGQTFSPDDLVYLGNGTVVFTAYDANGMTTLWSSDISTTGSASGAPTDTMTVTTTGAATGPTTVTTTITRTDTTTGATAVTTAVTSEIGGLGDSDLAYVRPGALDVQNLTRIGNKAIFSGADASGYEALWVTDGTTAGTFEIGGVNNAGVAGAGAHGLAIQDVVATGSLAYFDAADNSGQERLWVTDGTAAGTHVVSASGAYASTFARSNLADATNMVAANVNAASYGAAALAAMSTAQIAALAASGLTRIASDGSVVLSLAQAQAFAGAGLTLAVPSGASATISGLVSAPALSTAQVAALIAAGFTGANLTAQQFGALTSAQMQTLKADGPGQVLVGGSVSLGAANALSFADDGLTLALPATATASVLDAATALAKLNAAQISALAKAGFGILDAKSGSLTFSLTQSTALQTAGVKLETSKGATATENEASGAYVVYSGPTGAFSSSKTVKADGGYEIIAAVSGHNYNQTETIDTLVSGKAALAATAYENANGSGSLTLAATSAAARETLACGGGALNLTVGADVWSLPFHSSETITLQGSSSSAGHTLSFVAGFGAETISGLKLSGAGYDSLNFDPSLFASMIDLGNHCTQSGANLVITDSSSDSLTLSNIKKTAFLASAHVVFTA